MLDIDIAKNTFQLYSADHSTTPSQTSPASGNSGSQTLCMTSSEVSLAMPESTKGR
jgi:hypothetical protein